MLGKEWIGKKQPGFDRSRLNHTETGSGRDPARGIPVEMLPLGFAGPAINRFYAVRLGPERS